MNDFADEDDSPKRPEPASRLARLGARIVDTVIALAITVPVMSATNYWQRAFEQQVGLQEVLLYAAGGFAAYLLLHGYFLATRGQTLGKMLLGVRIVDYHTGQLVNVVKLIVMRDLAIGLVSMVPYVGGCVGLVDILFIFGQDRRCLHDMIAGTEVVKA